MDTKVKKKEDNDICVITYSPKGIDIPTDAEMQKMFKKNPHGAGFAITRPDGFTEWHKGYMTYDAFKAKLDEFDTDLLRDNPVTLHFRITTKGNTDEKTTHPFPVSPRFADMQKLHGITQGPLAFHNGTIEGFGGIGASTSSDSQDFVMGPLYHLMKGIPKDRGLGKLRMTAIEQLLGPSRLLIMMPDGEVIRVGKTWTHHTDKCFYSNMLWNSTASATSAYSSRAAAPLGRTITNSQVPMASSTVKLDNHVSVTPGKVPDEWGKHHYQGAWPGEGRHWIQFVSGDIMRIALQQMTQIITPRQGQTSLISYKHKPTGYIYTVAEDHTILTEDGKKMKEQYENFLEFEEESKEEMEKAGQMVFETLNDLSEFLELLKENKDKSYHYKGRAWYADYDAICLYTKDYLDDYFGEKTKDVIKSLLENGYIEEDLYLVDEEDLKLNIHEASNEEKVEQVSKLLKATN